MAEYSWQLQRLGPEGWAADQGEGSSCRSEFGVSDPDRFAREIVDRIKPQGTPWRLMVWRTGLLARSKNPDAAHYWDGQQHVWS